MRLLCIGEILYSICSTEDQFALDLTQSVQLKYSVVLTLLYFTLLVRLDTTGFDIFFRWHWFIQVRLSLCCKGWTLKSQTGFTSKASFAQATSLKRLPATSVCVQPSSHSATSRTSVQERPGSATSHKIWAVRLGSPTAWEESGETSRPRRRSCFKGKVWKDTTGILCNLKFFHVMYLLREKFQ